MEKIETYVHRKSIVMSCARKEINSKLILHSPGGDVIRIGSRYPDRTAETRSISLTHGKELWLEKDLKLFDPAGTTHTTRSFPFFSET